MFNLGSKVTVSRGVRGLRPDFYVGVIAEHPRTERIDGRLTTVADVITAQKTRAGEWRLAKQLQNLQFVFPARRPDADAAALLLIDGPAHAPKSVQETITEQALAAMAYLESRPVSLDEMELSDIES